MSSAATGNLSTISMAGEESPWRRRLALGWVRGGMAGAFAVAVLVGCPHDSHAQAGPTETQILELLKRKRVTRCPISPSDARCGEPAPLPSRGGMPVQEIEVYFGYASAAVEGPARTRLCAFASDLERTDHVGVTLLIAGHADATGSHAYNQRLSERRAAAVERFLVDHCGISGEMLTTIGFGKRRPKNRADPYAGESRRMNIGVLLRQRE